MANAAATLVGQPTGGNLRGLNGGQLAWITLPASGVAVDIPLLAAIHPGDPPDAGRGLFTDVFVTSTDGRVRAYADSQGVHTPAVDVSDRDYFRRTVTERRPLISEPLTSRILAEPVVVFTHPLIDASGAVFGVLGGTLRLAEHGLLEEGANTSDGDTSALTMVTDSRGRLLSHLPGRKPLQSRRTVAFQQRATDGRIIDQRPFLAFKPECRGGMSHRKPPHRVGDMAGFRARFFQEFETGRGGEEKIAHLDARTGRVRGGFRIAPGAAVDLERPGSVRAGRPRGRRPTAGRGGAAAGRTARAG